MTFYATAVNVVRYWLHEQHLGQPTVLWTLAVIAALCVAWRAGGRWAQADGAPMRTAFLPFMWVMLVLSYLKTFINHTVLNAPQAAVESAGGRWHYTLVVWGSGFSVDACFTIVAIVLTLLVYRVISGHPAQEETNALRASEALT